MKKIFTILIALLMVAGNVYAGAPPAPAYENAIYAGGKMEPGTPPMEYVLVRYQFQEAGIGAESITSGDSLIWSTTSADAFTISKCITDNSALFAGIAVTTILTPDSSTVDLTEDNWGYAAISGYVLARVDTSSATAGEPLVTYCDTGGPGLLGTVPTAVLTVSGGVSLDIGVLLSDGGADGLMPIWLR